MSTPSRSRQGVGPTTVLLVATLVAVAGAFIDDALGGLMCGLAAVTIAVVVSGVVTARRREFSSAFFIAFALTSALGLLMAIGFGLLFLGVRLQHQSATLGVAAAGLIGAAAAPLVGRTSNAQDDERRSQEPARQPLPWPSVATALVVLIAGIAIGVSLISDNRYRERQSYTALSIVGQTAHGARARTVLLEIDNTKSQSARFVLYISVTHRGATRTRITVGPGARSIKKVVVPKSSRLMARLYLRGQPKSIYREVRMGAAE